MQTILEYIMMNYTWIIVGSIIILLAIIGYYADKTNFGQGKTSENENEDMIDINSLQGKRMEDLLQKDENQNLTEPVKNSDLDSNTEIAQGEENINVNSEKNIPDKFEDSFEKFDKEFNELLPKKEIIDNELLDEINEMSLDKTQKIEISDIPTIDDVELPEIKTLSIEDNDGDIWRF